MAVKGILIDITGVLYESGVGFGTVIETSVKAIQRLQLSGIPFRLISNESSSSKEALLKKLKHHGFELTEKDIFSPIPAIKSILRENNLRPYVLVHRDVRDEFKEFNQNDPTCIVLGDADLDFTFENMNNAFNFLVAMKKPILYSLGKGKYYRHNNKLQLDVGAFATALEYACDVQAIVIGKPSADYFQAALDDMNIRPGEAAMIGDDISSDVGGAQKFGMKGILVKTGKFTEENLHHPSVKPDFIADNLHHAVDHLLGNS